MGQAQNMDEEQGAEVTEVVEEQKNGSGNGESCPKNDILQSPTEIKAPFQNRLTNEEKAERKRKRNDARRLVEENFKTEISEQRHKRLMHLLKESQFYSRVITNKNKAESKKAKSAAEPLAKKRKTSQPRKFDVEGYQATSSKSRDKKPLNKLEVEKYLNEDSDEENSNPNTTNLNLEMQVQNTEDFEYPTGFIGELRKYQIEGLQWLKLLHENGINGILADEMGLGKTIQVIALLCHALQNEMDGPYLVVAPLSTLSNWLLEFERFAPELKVVLFHGNAIVRSRIKKNIKKKSKSNNFETLPIVLTSYEMVLAEENYLRRFKWQYIVIDEGQRIKNPDCYFTKAVKKIPALHRLLLTGTPLQNNLKELWSLLNFLLPEMFNDLAVFEEWIDVEDLQNEGGTQRFVKLEEDKKVISSLREILKPFMLRRLKDDVCKDIPPKKEVIVYAPLTELQHSMYTTVLNYDLDTLLANEKTVIVDDENGKRPMRKCRVSGTCNPSTLVKTNLQILTEKLENCEGFEERYRDFLNPIIKGRLAGYGYHIHKRLLNHPYLVHWRGEEYGLPIIDNQMIQECGKLMVLDQMLSKLYEQGHKILLFSSMTMVLDMLEDYLSMRPKYKYCRLDGNVQLDDRTDNIREFNNDPEVFLFLMTARAGGVGINLTAADTVIIYDSDWNPQIDIQAMARCHRIGQTVPVITYKLCAKGTLDEKIIFRAEAKRKLEKVVISKKGTISNNKQDILDLIQLLESSDNCVANSENGAAYTDAEMEALLDRSDLWAMMGKNPENAKAEKKRTKKSI